MKSTTYSLHRSSFFGFTSSILGILQGNPQKELQWRLQESLPENLLVQMKGKGLKDQTTSEGQELEKHHLNLKYGKAWLPT